MACSSLEQMTASEKFLRTSQALDMASPSPAERIRVISLVLSPTPTVSLGSIPSLLASASRAFRQGRLPQSCNLPFFHP